MFICDFCNNPIGPKVKPILVVLPSDWRPVTYTNVVVDPETEEKVAKTTLGAERIAEHKACPACTSKVEGV